MLEALRKRRLLCGGWECRIQRLFLHFSLIVMSAKVRCSQSVATFNQCCAFQTKDSQEHVGQGPGVPSHRNEGFVIDDCATAVLRRRPTRARRLFLDPPFPMICSAE